MSAHVEFAGIMLLTRFPWLVTHHQALVLTDRVVYIYGISRISFCHGQVTGWYSSSRLDRFMFWYSISNPDSRFICISKSF